MILVGNQRGGAKDLALHLMNSHDNEAVELHELRGFMSSELMGALNEVYAISRGTKCSKYLYSLSLNPPKGETASIADFEAAIEDAEQRLGLQGQPRAIVFHEKHGRRHAHVVWSRIDINTMKARHIAYDREKLNALSHELFIKHGWEIPDGYKNREQSNSYNYTHAQHQQAKRADKRANDIKRDFQEAWEQSDDRASFEHALAEKGYFLACGRNGRFVAVDMQGEVYSVPKQLAKGINTKQVRAKLGDAQELPSVEEVLARIKQMQPEQSDAKAQPQKTFGVNEAIAEVTRYHAAFTQKMMERTLYNKVKDDDKRQTLIEELLKSDQLMPIGKRDGQIVYSTAGMIALEQRLSELAQDMAQKSSHPVNEHAVHRAIYNLNTQLAAETDGKAALSKEQIASLQHMTKSEQLSLVVGVAGAGKTTIMAGAKDAYAAQGYRVRGAAPSGIAASGLKEIGINASTLHSLEYRIKIAQDMLDEHDGKPLTLSQRDFIQRTMLSSKDVLIVDEAGMVSAPQSMRIMDLCQQSGAKLVLVGDPQQLQSIEAGTAFKTLLDRHDATSITEVRRQKSDWQRDATIALSQGNVTQALDTYNKYRCIQRSKTHSDAKDKLVKDVMKAHRKNPDASRLVLAYTRKDVADLNDLIKAEMVKAGVVSKDNVTADITVTDGDTEYQAKQDFAVGDRILFRKNDAQLGVMNGTFGTLREVSEGQFHVELDNGKTVSFSPSDYNHLQLGYATTIHKSQGVTVDETYVLATPHFDQHTSYVAMSRHKNGMKMYISKRDFKNHNRLCQVLGKDGDKLSTLDFINEPQCDNAKMTWMQRIKQSWQRLRGHTTDTPEMYEATYQPETQTQPSHEQTLKQSYDKPLSQQDFEDMRDAFVKHATTQEQAQQRTTSHDHQPSQERGLER